MGLDIIAYGIATPVGALDDVAPISDDGVPTSWCPHNDPDADPIHVMAFAYKSFEWSMRGLQPGRCYVVDNSFHFAAGSYSGYGAWRCDLARVVLSVSAIEEVWNDVEHYRDEPFFELIHFADNEGTIGPEAALDLAQDFDEWRAVYVAAHSDDSHDWDVQKYDEWTKAFKIAAGTGLVEFR